MSTQSNYYKLIQSRLEKSASLSQANSALDELSINDSVTTDYLTQNYYLASLSYINPNLNESRKFELRNWHQFANQIFFTRYSIMKKRVKKDYERVTDKFIEFSSELNPEDLELFMEHTFKITYENSDFKLPYSGYQI